MSRDLLRAIGGLVCLVCYFVGTAASWAQSGTPPFEKLVVQLKQDMDEIQTKSSGDPTAQHDLAQLRHALPTLAPEFPLPKSRTAATVETYRRYGLTRYYTVDVSKLSSAQAEALLQKIKSNPLVDDAYLKVPPHEIDDNAVPVTQLMRADPPDYTPQQYYLYAPTAIAPGFKIGGVNAEEAWRRPGGDGGRARIVSVEMHHWEFGHIDLPDPFIKHWNEDQHTVGDHDTKSVGTMVSKNNGFGTTGIAYGAAIGYSKYDNAGVQLLDLGNMLQAGDVIQIGIQYRVRNLDVVFGCGETCYVPVDYYNDVVSAIRYLTHERGIHVIEAAANGNINLDDPYFQGRFDRSRNDSGAIMVGAADPKTGRRASYSDYGSRVDVYSWGWHVTTTTYDPKNPTRGYTDSYGGTSSANPIVSATAAVMQSVARAEGIGNMSPSVMRRILAETGTPLPSGDRSIGAQPDLVAGITRMQDEYGAGNPAPQARITGPDAVQAGSKLKLSGEDSSGKDLGYSWSAEGFSPATATTQDVELTAPSNTGPREISLTVKDATGRTHTSRHTVTVIATSEPITATLTVPAQVRSGEPVPVRVDAKSETGRPLSYAWARTTALFEGSIGNKPSGNYTAAVVISPASGTINVTVSDDRGHSIKTPNQPVTVLPTEGGTPVPPTIRLNPPQVSGGAPATVTLTSSASVNGATISKVEYFNGSNRLGEASSAPYKYNWPNVAAGSYSVTGKATTSQGVSADSAPVSVTVAPSDGGGTCDYRDPAAAGVPAWQSRGYSSGERVSYQHVIWQAGYSTGIAAPDSNDAWTLVSNVPVPYSGARAFDGGKEVTYQGSVYRAGWWTKGTAPPASPWILVGPCR